MPKKIHIPNSKGRQIAAVIHRPEQKTEKLAILCPGYLDTKDYAHLVALAEQLSQAGYTAVRFDPTGTWESEGEIAEYLTSQYLEDVKSVLEHMLLENQYSSVLLAGHSRGGMVSLLYAARDPRISYVVGIMPSSLESHKDQEEWERSGFRISRRDIPGENGEEVFSVPFAHALDRNRFNVFNEVGNIHVPALFLAGELDEVVPASEVKEIFDRANEPKTFVLMKGIGHDYRHDPEEIAAVNAEILRVLQ